MVVRKMYQTISGEEFSWELSCFVCATEVTKFEKKAGRNNSESDETVNDSYGSPFFAAFSSFLSLRLREVEGTREQTRNSRAAVHV